MRCTDCPRRCGADRERGEVGFCGGGRYARIAKVIDNFAFEEPCLGDGLTAVFFGGCALKCCYCQNLSISRNCAGMEYNDAELASLFDECCAAIDLVTPSHYLKNIERAMSLRKGNAAVVYNSSGYETEQSVERAASFTSVFLTDFKYADGELAARFSGARDYPDVVVKAIGKMKSINDEWEEVDGKRLLRRGVIVRHLVLPGCVDNSIKALDMLKSHFGADIVLSLMSQFIPNGVGEPSARLKKLEYKLVAEHALNLGFSTGYFQDFSSASTVFVPKF